jgi:hypothetical protein
MDIKKDLPEQTKKKVVKSRSYKINYEHKKTFNLFYCLNDCF